MQRPAIHWTRNWVSIPELRLQQLSTRRIEAAQVLDHRRVVAAQLRIRARLERVHCTLRKHHLRTTKSEFPNCPERRHSFRYRLSSRGNSTALYLLSRRGHERVQQLPRV